MSPIAQFAALVAALMHVGFFYLESIVWSRPTVWSRFRIASQADADIVRPMALNQGFYNLFLGLGHRRRARPHRGRGGHRRYGHRPVRLFLHGAGGGRAPRDRPPLPVRGGDAGGAPTDRDRPHHRPVGRGRNSAGPRDATSPAMAHDGSYDAAGARRTLTARPVRRREEVLDARSDPVGRRRRVARAGCLLAGDDEPAAVGHHGRIAERVAGRDPGSDPDAGPDPRRGRVQAHGLQHRVRRRRGRLRQDHRSDQAGRPGRRRPRGGRGQHAEGRRCPRLAIRQHPHAGRLDEADHRSTRRRRPVRLHRDRSPAPSSRSRTSTSRPTRTGRTTSAMASRSRTSSSSSRTPGCRRSRSDSTSCRRSSRPASRRS